MAAARLRDESETGVAPAGARNDAYTGMLIISLAAMLLGCLLLLLEYFSYSGDTKPPAVNLGVPPKSAAPAPLSPAAPSTPAAPVGTQPGR